jgi:2-dehydropantoate 2-reductase
MASDAMATARPIGVLGAGAMGSLFAGLLALAGFPVVLIGRPSPHLRAIESSGLTLETPTGHRRSVALQIATSTNGIPPISALIVLVKSWATADAVAAICDAIPRDALILTLQNGLGNREAILTACEPHDPALVISGITSEAALIPAPGVVIHTGHGSTAIGLPRGAGIEFAADLGIALANAGLPARLAPAIEQDIWRKLAINAGINGVTALSGVVNGEVASDAGLLTIALRAGAEVAAVARAQDIDIGEVDTAIIEVARATGRNRSSMLRDLETGRRTEADAIYGAVSRIAAEHRVEVPVCDTLGALVSARERAGMATTGKGDG